MDFLYFQLYGMTFGQSVRTHLPHSKNIQFATNYIEFVLSNYKIAWINKCEAPTTDKLTATKHFL